MLDGVVRKLSFVAVFLSSVGWVVFCIGFGIRNEWLTNAREENVVHINYFYHWCLAVSTFPLYFLSFMHLLCGNKCTGAMTLLLVPVFLISVGGVLQRDSDYLYKYHRHTVEYVDHVPVEFAGALAAAVFYWLSLALWMCFSDRKKSASHPAYRPINNY